MKQTALCSIVLLILLLTNAIRADEFLEQQPLEILPVEEAFRFGVVEDAESYNLFWQVHPGYFLYRDKFAVFVDGEDHLLDLPEGQWHDDETFGRVQVLAGYVELQIPRSRGLVSNHYQGCAVKGFCYPPQRKSLNSAKNSLNSGILQ